MQLSSARLQSAAAANITAPFAGVRSDHVLEGWTARANRALGSARMQRVPRRTPARRSRLRSQRGPASCLAIRRALAGVTTRGS